MTNPNFEIRIYFPFDDNWAERDAALHIVTGPSDWGGAGNGLRDIGYIRETFEAALDLRHLVWEHWPDYKITIQEAMPNI